MSLSIFGGVIEDLIAAGILFLIGFLLRKRIAMEIRMLLFKILKVGLLNTVPKYDKISDMIISKGKKAIRIHAMGVQLSNLMTPGGIRDSPLDKILCENPHHKLDVKLLLLKPDSNYVIKRAGEIHRDHRGIEQSISNAINQLRLAKNEYCKTCNIQIKLYDENPIWCLLFIGELLFIGCYLSNFPRPESPCYICQRGFRSPYAAFDKYFDYMWGKSQTLEEWEASRPS
jgi:hypothetical protein